MTQSKRGQSKGGQGATRSQSPTSPEAIARLERDLKCVRLRSANVSWQGIADQLGYADPGHAHQRFMHVMRTYPREDIDTWRNLISDRHEAILRTLWPKVLQGDQWAMDRAQRGLEALAKLHGANRPEKLVITPGESDLDKALRELTEQLEARAAGHVVQEPAKAP